MNRPISGESASVFIVKEGAKVAVLFAPGSGIVGFERGSGTIHVYYEGNVYGAENVKTWDSKVRMAYGRMVQKYPTVAQMICNAEDLVEVGVTDGDVVSLTDSATLRSWLAHHNMSDSAPASDVNRLLDRPKRNFGMKM